MSARRANLLTLALASLALQALSCQAGDALPDQAALNRQLAAEDPAATKTLLAAADQRSRLEARSPGALYLLARQQAAAGQWAAAAAFYQAELDCGADAWTGPAWRGRLDAARQAADWDWVLGRGSAGQAAVAARLAGGADPAAAARESAACRDDWRRTEIEALAQSGRPDRARAAIDAAWGTGADAPDWLGFGRARLALAAAGGSAKPWTRELFDRLVPLLALDAQADHAQIADAAAALAARRPPADAPTRTLLELLALKADLARGKAAAVYERLDGYLAPRGKAGKAERQRRAERQGLLRQVLARSPVAPTAFFRDAYNASRLAGQLSDGARLMDELRVQVAPALDKAGARAAAASLLEYKGRLLRAKNDYAGAAPAFEQAMDLAAGAEDRRRLRWYLLRGLCDRAGDFDAGAAFDAGEFARLAAGCDDPAYFDDLFEQAALTLGGRRRWAELADLLEACRPAMAPDRRAHYALILARAGQLGLDAPEGRRERLERYGAEARDAAGTLYCRAAALWLRGEALDLDAALAALSADAYRGGAPAAAPGAPPAADAWAARVADSMLDAGLYEAAAAQAWELRREIEPARLAAIGGRLVEAQRYRLGLRLLESLRVRVGHPGDGDRLASFYPRPYLEQVGRAVAGTGLPESLFYALVRTESNFDEGANSGAGARGLAQLMPATAELVARKRGMDPANPDDPGTNLRLGACYLADQYQAFGRWPQALAAYNAGLGRVRGWLKAGLPADPLLFAELVPYEESRAYVRRIVEGALLYDRLYYRQGAQALMDKLLGG